MNNHLVIGGAGFIGSNLVNKLLNKGQKVYVIDNLSRLGSKKLLKLFIGKKNYVFNKIDIKNKKKINQFFKKKNFRYIYLLAGQVAVTKSIIDPLLDLQSNLIGTFNVLEAIKKYNKDAILIYSSTNKVYGKLNNLKIIEKNRKYVFRDFPEGINERHKTDFVTPYGCSKGAADLYCQDYSSSFGLKTIVMRQSCIYGPYQLGMEDQGWVAWLTIAALKNKKITIYGNGKQVRDLLYVDDLTDAYLLAANNIKQTNGNFYNVGGGENNSISILDYIYLLEKILKKKIRYKFDLERLGDQKVFISDNSKSYKEYRWKPKINIEEGVNNMIKWLSKQI